MTSATRAASASGSEPTGASTVITTARTPGSADASSRAQSTSTTARRARTSTSRFACDHARRTKSKPPTGTATQVTLARRPPSRGESRAPIARSRGSRRPRPATGLTRPLMGRAANLSGFASCLGTCLVLSRPGHRPNLSGNRPRGRAGHSWRPAPPHSGAAHAARSPPGRPTATFHPSSLRGSR
jgi:hypothetical protein